MQTRSYHDIRAGVPALALVTAFALAPLAVSVADSAVAAEVRNPNGVAVLVGNRDYRMDHARRDAEAFKHYVLDFGGVRPASMWAADKATADSGQLASWSGGAKKEYLTSPWLPNGRGQNAGLMAAGGEETIFTARDCAWKGRIDSCKSYQDADGAKAVGPRADGG